VGEGRSSCQTLLGMLGFPVQRKGITGSGSNRGGQNCPPGWDIRKRHSKQELRNIKSKLRANCEMTGRSDEAIVWQANILMRTGKKAGRGNLMGERKWEGREA